MAHGWRPILPLFRGSDPRRALEFIASAARDLSDWAVCDTLGTQGVRKLLKVHGDDLFEHIRKALTWIDKDLA